MVGVVSNSLKPHYTALNFSYVLFPIFYVDLELSCIISFIPNLHIHTMTGRAF